MKKYILLAFCLFCVARLSAQTRVDTLRSQLLNPDDSRVFVVTHRGDWRNACENSLEAIESAISLGAEIVEIDLQQTKDGALILMHDKKLDRTTTGKGYVADFTLEEIKKLKLRNGAGIRSASTVPTLEEALLLAKGRVMLNLDKAFDYFDQVYDLLESTGTTNLAIMKSDMPAADVKKSYGKYLTDVIFMPKVDLDKPDAIAELSDYLEILHPAAIELCFDYDSNQLPHRAKELMRGRSRIWYNTLWDTHAGGHDDDCSLVDPEGGYGYLIDSLGTTIIQTDRTAYLKKYLATRFCDALSYDDNTLSCMGSEYVPTSSSNFTIIESFLKSKRDSAILNEDGIVVTNDFAAVIDGATAKSSFKYEGKTTGRLAMELISEAVRCLPSDADVLTAVDLISAKINDFYRSHNMLDSISNNPATRFTACAVIYSHARGEVWQIGDCQCIVGTICSSNSKEIDEAMAQARSAMNEVYLTMGFTEEELRRHDYGRDFIAPFLNRQAILQNCPDVRQQYAFAVFDGFKVRMDKVNVFPVGNASTIELSSDGYPRLFSSLRESEAYLRYILDNDPLCMKLYKSTKGVGYGNISFDDRAYLKIRIK